MFERGEYAQGGHQAPVPAALTLLSEKPMYGGIKKL